MRPFVAGVILCAVFWSPWQAPVGLVDRALAQAPAARPGSTEPTPRARFDTAMELARTAAERGQHDESLRAVREALRSGPPPAGNQGQGRQPGVVRVFGGQIQDDELVSDEVAERIAELVNLWNHAKVPAVEQYTALSAIAFPEGRPGEIFLYPRMFAVSDVQRLSSVGRLVAASAVQADRVEDLRQRVLERQDQPVAKLSGQVLLAMAALERGDSGTGPARLALRELQNRLESDPRPKNAELACHAAILALDRAALTSQAQAVLELAADRLAAAPTRMEDAGGALLRKLGRIHLEKGDAENARRSLRKYADLVQKMNAEVGEGPAAAIWRRRLYHEVAFEFALGGMPVDALEMLGQFADLPSRPSGDPVVGPALSLVARWIGRLPAQERYELLKNWTLPAPGRETVRHLADFAFSDRVPEAFTSLAIWNRLSAGAETPAGAQRSATQATSDRSAAIVSTAELLIEAARAAGRLDELSNQIRDAAAKGLENGLSLALLVAMAHEDPSRNLPEIEKRQADYADRFPRAAATNRPGPIDWAEYLLARSCFVRPEYQRAAERYQPLLVNHARPIPVQSWLAVLNGDLARYAARNNGAELGPTPNGGLAMWRVSSHRSRSNSAVADTPAWWVAAGDHVAHVAGPGEDFLYFRYPLLGEFEFSMESSMRGWDEGNLSYGGLVFEAVHGAAVSKIFPVGYYEVVNRPDALERNDFNRVMLKVGPAGARCLVNDHLVFETADPSPTSPWLALYTRFNCKSVFRNLKLTGDVRIPREVPLSHGDRLEGWIGTLGDTLPPRLTVGERIPNPAGRVIVRNPAAEAFTWTATDGVIVGRKAERTEPNAPAQRRLHYLRPMHDGEMVRYEFLYDPQQSEVHPALDRLTFVLAPEGVRLHWTTDRNDVDPWTGLAGDNIADEPENRRGPQPLPLKRGEWNGVRIRLENDVAILELNGSEIYRRTIESWNDRTFGFQYDPRRAAARVRNVVLSGNWPERLAPDRLANLLVPPDEGPAAASTRRAREAIVDDFYISLDGENIQRRARALPLAQRYAFLRAWVCPSPEHRDFRLQGSFTPTSPPVVDPAGTAAAKSVTGRRVVTGGELTAPVLDLLAAAGEANKLDEIAGLVAQSPAETLYEQRNRLAMLALVSMAQGNAPSAATYFRQLLPLAGQLDVDTPNHMRWPELVVAIEGFEFQELQRPAFELLDAMTTLARKSASRLWENLVRTHRDRARFLSEFQGNRVPLGADPAARQWSRVTHGTAMSHGTGLPPAHWQSARGEALHVGGHSRDYLYFQSPLEGNFEVQCRLTLRDSRAAQITWGGTLIGLRDSLAACELSHYGRADADGGINPALEISEEWYDYRLVVRNGTQTAYVNGRKIREQAVSARPDAWLAVHSLGPLGGRIRDLRISGTPTIPERLELSALPDLTAWLSDYYAETIAGENPDWRKEGEEIIGRKRDDIAGSRRQSLLRYHRPLLEDGTLEYEFQFIPGKTHVHPALDRLAFLIEPAGIRLHRLTDAQWERTGLAHDNVLDEPADRRGPPKLPLRENDWNRLVLSLKGDIVSLALNGDLVYERALEPTNQRNFGLFHYADESEVRVRNIAYRGDWPRTLPLPADQELAAEPARNAK